MSFDLSIDEFREVHLPGTLWKKSSLSLSRLRESLVLLDYNRNSTTDKQVCDVWMMEHGDPKAFTKLFTINASVGRTLGFKKTGEPIFEMQDGLQSAIVVYEPCPEHIKDLGIFGTGYVYRVYSYTESLLLLDHDDGHIASLRCGDVKS